MLRLLTRTLVVVTCLLSAVTYSVQSGEIDPPLADGLDAATKQLAVLRLPPGLKAEVFAAEPQLASPVAICLDEQGRVYVAEEYRFNRGTEENRTRPFLLEDDLQIKSLEERLAVFHKFADRFEGGMNWFTKYTDQVRRLEDKDGDGRADSSTVFATGFNGPLDGLAAGLLARDGDVYLTNIPHLWKLRDENGDGVADKREKLLTGFGVNCGFLGHDLHGVVWGPEGKLYFSVGDRGFRVTTKEGRTIGEPRRGAIFRCNPDGSELEVVHRGLRNPQEIAFDEWGNLFAADNNCDKGDHSRLVYVVEGGDSGWNMAYQTILAPYETGPWHAEKIWHVDGAEEAEVIRPAWVLPPVGKLGAGPSGFAYCGAAGWPENVRGRFYMCNYTGNGGIESFGVKAKGASFEVVDPQDFVKPLSATDCEFGYDGKLYVSDFVGLDWSGKTKGGRIYTVHSPEESAKPVVKEVRELFHRGFAKQSAEELAALLRHPDQRVRQRAQFTLMERREIAVLKHVLLDSPRDGEKASRLARLHSLWALGQQPKDGLAHDLAALLDDEDPQVQTHTARIMGERRHLPALDKLVKLLESPHPPVQMQAAIALGRLGQNPNVVKSLFQLLRTNANRDKYLRHAGVYGLSLTGDVKSVRVHLDDPDPAVRLGALLVLRRWSDPTEVGWKPESIQEANFANDIARYLLDSEMPIVVEAARAINDLHLDAAQPQLAALATSILRSPQDAPEALTRRVINANFRLGEAEHAAAVARLAAEPKLSIAMRREALEALADWKEPGKRDRVTGYWRPVSAERNLEATRHALEAAIPQILASATGDLAPIAAKVVARLELKTDDETFVAWAGDANRPVATRAAALRLLGSRKRAQFQELFEAALVDDNPRYRAEALRIVTEFDPPRALAACTAVLNTADSEVVEKQQALASLVTLQQPAGDALLEEYFGRLRRRTLSAGLQLDVLEAAQARGTAALKEFLVGYEKSLPADDSLARFRVTQEGGDVERGREIFFGHRQAQCVRCHKIEGRGGDAGPDFTRLASNVERRYIVQSLVHPDAMIAEGFGNLTLRLADGSTVGGRLKRKRDEGLELILPDGSTRIVPHAEIEQRSELKSPMPAMDKTLTLREMRDLVEFLMTRK